MRQSDAPRPISRTPRKARRPVALGLDAERDARLPELGKALDALVQAIRGGEALADGLSRRCHELWLEHKDRVFEWRATEVRAAGKVVLAADARVGRFVAPAFAAGLRALALRERSVPRDLLRFARQLSALAHSELTPEGFAQFLFGGGLLGFDAGQTESAREVGENLAPFEHDSSAFWLEHSSHAVAQWNELSFRAGKVMDARTLQARFVAPLHGYESRLVQGELALSAQAAERLRAAADDAAAFAAAETGLWLSQPKLRAALPNSHLGFRMLDWIAGCDRVDPQLFERMERLIVASDEVEPDEAIDLHELGEALAERLLVAGIPDESWLELAERVQPALFEGVLARLSALAARPDARAVLAAFARAWGTAKLFEQLEPAAMKPELAVELLGLALEAGEAPQLLARVLDALPLEALLAACSAWPQLASVAKRPLQRGLAQELPRAAPYLPALAAAGGELAALVGHALALRRCADVPQDALRATLAALVQAELGAAYVMPLWEARGGCSTATRLVALRALALDPRMLAAALGRSAPGLLEPPEIRDAIEELRWSDK